MRRICKKLAVLFAGSCLILMWAGRAWGAESRDIPKIPGLTYESSMELVYAQGFDVHRYQGGYSLVDIHDSGRFLVIPQGKEAPEGLSEEVVPLKQPLSNVYLAATAVMSLFDALDALDHIRFSGAQADHWYIQGARERMEAGEILFAGKYNEPDYELLIGEDCSLAIESTMILHAPKVQEMLEDLGIPVLVDHSSYESHPLGRTEWIRLYGVLTGKEEAAETFFAQQSKIMEEMEGFPNTEKRVAYFYISTEGTAVVRSETDYIPKMIEIAGGRYAFEGVRSKVGESASVSMTMEDFYEQAVDADYLIYNASIDAPITTVEELLAKSQLFSDFKAVQEGNVWCTGKYLYQATDIVGELIRDIHGMLTGEAGQEMTFLSRCQ